MELTVHGKQMDVGDALRTHVATRLEDINQKFFNRAFDTVVTFSPEGHGFFRCHISLRVGKDILVSATSTAAQAPSAFDDAAQKIAKQLRRYKTRLRDHHERIEQTPEAEMTKARDYILAESGKEEEEDDIPVGDDAVVVAETDMRIQKMSVSDAVMRLDLAGQTALLFRNPKTNNINMVYRRNDGNIGWVEPLEEKGSAKA